MPTSSRPRKTYGGSRALRDLQRPRRSITGALANEMTSGVLQQAAKPQIPRATAPVTARSAGRLSRRRLTGIGAGAALAGGGAYAAHRRRSRVRKGDEMILRDPFSGDLLEVGKAAAASPATGTDVRFIPARTPSGPHVSHENDYKRFKHRSKFPKDARVQVYHSGGESGRRNDRGGGMSFGARSRRVNKSHGLRQPIIGGGAERGSRGSPLSELGRQNRVGHRLR